MPPSSSWTLTVTIADRVNDYDFQADSNMAVYVKSIDPAAEQVALMQDLHANEPQAKMDHERHMAEMANFDREALLAGATLMEWNGTAYETTIEDDLSQPLRVVVLYGLDQTYYLTRDLGRVQK